jgi:hypothetical protein
MGVARVQHEGINILPRKKIFLTTKKEGLLFINSFFWQRNLPIK